MDTRIHLTRAVGTAPEYEVPPHAEESWNRGELVFSASFKLALSGGSRTRSKIRCQNAESQDLGLKDKALPSQIAVGTDRRKEVLLCNHVCVPLSQTPREGCVGISGWVTDIVKHIEDIRMQNVGSILPLPDSHLHLHHHGIGLAKATELLAF